MPPDQKFDWSRLNHLQIGKYAEYYVKMEAVLYGYDVYSAEVDDRGIDFVLRNDCNNYFDVQVKSVRGYNYIFFRKDRFEIRENMLAAVAIFQNLKAPDLYLIPATVWRNPNALFVSRDYGEGKKSAPEWGINLSAKNIPLLKQYDFSNSLSLLRTKCGTIS